MRIVLQCKCGGSLQLDQGHNDFPSDLDKQAIAWRKDHEWCIQNLLIDTGTTLSEPEEQNENPA